MLSSILVSGALAAACPEPTTVGDLRSALAEGEQAFAALDLVGLYGARDRSFDAVKCLGEQLTPRDAAAFHRLMALVAFTARQRAWVLSEFHAARRLDPDYALPGEVAQPGHPLHVAYEDSLEVDPGRRESVSPPVAGVVYVDGQEGAPRPTEISSLLQAYGPGGGLVESVALLPGEPTPVYGLPPVDWTRRRHRLLFVGSVGTGALSTLFQLATWGQRKAYFDTSIERTEAELAALRMRVNGSNYAAFGTGVLAVGFTTALVWSW